LSLPLGKGSSFLFWKKIFGHRHTWLNTLEDVVISDCPDRPTYSDCSHQEKRWMSLISDMRDRLIRAKKKKDLRDCL
jgi:hypothetical protein